MDAVSGTDTPKSILGGVAIRDGRFRGWATWQTHQLDEIAVEPLKQETRSDTGQSEFRTSG